MIKVETLGGIDVAKLNPVLKVNAEVANYQFVTDANGILYLVCNTLTGDDSYREGIKFAANTYLNGYEVKAWEGLKLVVDEAHIKYGVGENYDNITAGTTILKVDSTTGKLEIAQSTPTSGIYFKVTDKCRLTGKAVKVLVVADVAGATTLAGLTDVDTTGATNGQVLKYDGSAWKPAADATE